MGKAQGLRRSEMEEEKADKQEIIRKRRGNPNWVKGVKVIQQVNGRI